MIVWLLAFLAHSSLWLGLAWLWTRLLPSMHARTRETIWYTAMVASLVVPTVHVLAAGFGAWWTLPLPATLLGSDPGLSAVTPAPSQFPTPRDAWQVVGLWAWAGVSGALLLHYAARLAILRRMMAPRTLGHASPEAVALKRLSQRAGLRRPPRLSESDTLGSPIAVGIGSRAEICVPTRAFHELDGDQFRAMLGHEVAHHMRHDPARLGIFNVLTALFWFQPMVRVAVRDVQRAAEEQCDAWAASRIDDRLAMASCLAEVATWILPRHGRLPAAGMAQSRSQLNQRVDRLMEADHEFEARGGLWRSFGAMSVLVLAPWVTPVVTPVHVPPTEAPVMTQPAEAVPSVGDVDGEHDWANAGDGEHGAGEAAREEHDGEGRETGEETGGDEHRDAEESGRGDAPR